jgi:putative glutamine amidotransferase
MGHCNIAVSKLAPAYRQWLENLYPGIELTDFDNRDPDDFTTRLHSYSGLLLTGGGDINPGLYGYDDPCNHSRGIDPRRDELEMRMTEAAFRHHLPVFAICRGLQVLNVYLGGTLITDIAACKGDQVVHKDQHDVMHTISLVAGSQINHITGLTGGTVNSSHHQAIDRLADGLIATAFSEDGIVEAIECKDFPGMFCLGVQWHPERMDLASPFSGLLGTAFLTVTFPAEW